jgi:hypothetical protein
MKNGSEILIYQNPAGEIRLDVRLEDETVWLTAHMAELFGKGRSTISELQERIRVDWRPLTVSSFATGYGGQVKMKLAGY